MSCSLCRLPFTPSETSVAPRWPPPGMLSDKQLAYMRFAVGIGQHVIGLVIDLVHLDNNLFVVPNSPIVVNIAWENMGKTFVALHPHCAVSLRSQLGLVYDTPDALVELSLLDQVIGFTQAGAHAGRFPCVNYEDVLGVRDSIDLESLWSKGQDAELPDFNWHEWKARGLEWTAARPDIFPRFRPTVSPARLASIGPLPESTGDIITTQPLDILHALLPHLSDASFVHLLATCRTLRRHALTTFQPHARTRVLALGWAVPTVTEYTDFLKRNPPPPRAAPKRPFSSPPTPGEQDVRADSDLAQVTMAHAEHSPTDADWQLYLSQVHRTPAMRARRWVWALAREVVHVYRAKKAASLYADEETVDAAGCRKVRRSAAWTAWFRDVEPQFQIRDMVLGRVGRLKPLNVPW